MAKSQQPPTQKITHADVRMYRMGTGDCFVLKFFTKNEDNTFTMMIDCGTWMQTNEHKLTTYVADIKKYVGEKPIDVLVVTHEHKDHVYGFEVCEEQFVNEFKFNEVWMGWCEDESGESLSPPLNSEVKEWKTKFGKQKKALKRAAMELNAVVNSDSERELAKNNFKANEALKFRQGYADALSEFAELHLAASGNDADPNYIGGMKGMIVVKEKLAKKNIKYFVPGQIIENIEGVEGIRIYVLGPPTSITAVQKEDSDQPGIETYNHSHNNTRTFNEAFAAAILNLDSSQSITDILPFDETFVDSSYDPAYEPLQQSTYKAEPRRTIEHDWLNSAGSLALRLTSGINNLSLALAIEFIDSNRIMLFPGDAEYGSWASWHDDISWKVNGKNNKPLKTEELLSRTVFYKVAHHLSHNGSAKLRGVEMMTHPDLAAMATLDYDRIAPKWTSTMPNSDLIAALLTRTKGRLMIMNEDKLYVDQATKKELLTSRLNNVRKQLMNSAEQADFEEAFIKDEDGFYLQYRVKA